MRAKNILVTGGAGFLGRHLCQALLRQGHNVFCLDNFYTGQRQNVLTGVTFIEHDICEPIDLSVDEIYNLACPASPDHYQKDPLYTTKTCVLGALNVLELARKNKAKVLQASTSEVYGDPIVHPQKETYRGEVSTTGPRACYDEGKRCAETLFFDHHRVHKTPIKIARIFNTYGPHMRSDDGRVVSNLIIQALSSKPLTLYGDGLQTRSFCYVDDLIRGLILLMESSHLGPINLGNPREFTIKELAEIILTQTGSKSPLEYRPLPEDDPKQRCPDIARAREKLNWKPEISVEHGVQETVSFFQGSQSQFSHSAH